MTKTNFKIIFEELETKTLDELKVFFNVKTKSAVIRKLIELARKRFLE